MKGRGRGQWGGRNEDPVNAHGSALVWMMSGLTRDGTAKPVSHSQGQIFRRERGKGKSNFPVRLTTSRICDHIRLFRTLLYNVMTTHVHAQQTTDESERRGGKAGAGESWTVGLKSVDRGELVQ